MTAMPRRTRSARDERLELTNMLERTRPITATAIPSRTRRPKSNEFMALPYVWQRHRRTTGITTTNLSYLRRSLARAAAGAPRFGTAEEPATSEPRCKMQRLSRKRGDSSVQGCTESGTRDRHGLLPAFIPFSPDSLNPTPEIAVAHSASVGFTVAAYHKLRQSGLCENTTSSTSAL